MLINFNIEKLDRLLYDFHCLTGLTISVWDAEFHQLSYQPKEIRSFCRKIKETPIGRTRCFLSDKQICMECGKTGKPATHYCHAGLIDTAVPIKFKNTILGYIMFGQISDGTDSDILKGLTKLGKELGIDHKELIEVYKELDIYNEEKIEAAANILKMSTRYLWLSEYIEIGYDTDASRIDDYIRAHISEDLSVKSLCAAFGINKNRLYEISHEWFGSTIGDYVAAVRIEEAKRLLSSTELPITQICAAVGIKDYNYFTKFFKSHENKTPLKYRKESHFFASEE